MIDFGIVFAIFVLWLLILSAMVQEIQNDQSVNFSKSSVGGLLSYFVLFFVYESLLVAASNRTIGKAIMGLLIVNHHGRMQKCRGGFLRSILKSLPFVVVGSLVSLFRIDRRGLIDLLASSTVIYAWDAEGYRIREQFLDEGEKLEDVYDDDDEDDEQSSGYNGDGNNGDGNNGENTKSVKKTLRGRAQSSTGSNF